MNHGGGWQGRTRAPNWPLVPAGGPHHRHGDGFHPGVFTVRGQTQPSKVNKGGHCRGRSRYISQMTCIPTERLRLCRWAFMRWEIVLVQTCFNSESLVTHIWRGSRCQIYCTSVFPNLFLSDPPRQPCQMNSSATPAPFISTVYLFLFSYEFPPFIHHFFFSPVYLNHSSMSPGWQPLFVFCWDCEFDVDTLGMFFVQDVSAIKWPLNDE